MRRAPAVQSPYNVIRRKGDFFMKTIAVNAGHTVAGNPGYGAEYKGFRESEITRAVAKALRAKLKARGFKVVNADVDKAKSQTEYLKKVCQIANASTGKGDLFISLHCNASASHKGEGTECWTWQGKQVPQAVKICENLAGLGLKNRKVKDGSSFYVVKHTKATAVLVELFFLDNEKDRVLYKKYGAEKIAEAIAESL